MAAKKKWSQRVTDTSDAMDIETGTFASHDPKRIAEAVERDAERSTRRKTTPYRSAMSMLTFYINRAGKNLPAAQRNVLERAKEILRAEFGRDGSATTKKTSTGARKRGA
jgi:putative cell wall-binding protein